MRIMLVGSVAALLGCAVTFAQDRATTTIQAIPTAPTLDTYLQLRSAFHGDRDSCQEVGATTSEASEAIVEMIEDGDAIALRTGLLVFRCWDGGLLGDFFRATGQYFDREPRDLVALLDSYLIWRTDVRSIVTTLPERAVDNADEQIGILRSRRASLTNYPNLSWLANELENEALRLESQQAQVGLRSDDLAQVEDAGLVRLLNNLEIVEERLELPVAVRVFRLREPGECDGPPPRCPTEILYIAVSEFDEAPDQIVLTLPASFGWQFNRWVAWPETDDAAQYASFEVTGRTAGADATVAERLFVVRVNRSGGTVAPLEP